MLISITVFIANEAVNEKNIIDILPLLGFYALCAFRLLPSINRIINMLQILKYGESVVAIVLKELQFKGNKRNEDYKNNIVEFNSKISFKNVNFSYQRNKPILKNLNLTIRKNSFIAISGQTGAGKSTLIKLILGLYKPTKGDIEIDNINILKKRKSFKGLISFVPQDIYLFDDTILKNVTLQDKVSKSDFERFINV